MNQLRLLQTPRNECVFSPCRKYRYVLKHKLDSGVGVCLWVMANPSKADEFDLDTTLTRCADYTERWGYAEMRVVNVRAWVSTDPKGVPADPIGIGPDNDNHIIEQAAQAKLVVCGWGALGGERGARVLQLLRPYCVPHALTLTKAGAPGHPLYLAKKLTPFALEVS